MTLNVILILCGSIFLVALLTFRMRKAINLSVIRMIYGQYSTEFFLTYKKFFVRSPFQYCFRDDFIAHILLVLTKKKDIPTFRSTQEIYFENTPYFINYKDFLRKRGEPYCFNAFIFERSDFEIKAIGYHETIAGSKATVVFYFMNDSFFMGEYIFKNPKTNIKANLVDHFLGTRELPDENFYIENTKNRIIHYQNTGFTLDIKYLDKEDEIIVRNLKEYHNYITGRKIVPEA